MQYTIKAHPTVYAGVRFRSRLEATWAAFFDLAGWKWEYEPIDLNGWVPDFYVKFECLKKRCRRASHELYVEVKPFRKLKEFEDTSAFLFEHRKPHVTRGYKDIPAIAYFGVNSDCTSWNTLDHGNFADIYIAEPNNLHDFLCDEHCTIGGIPEACKCTPIWKEAQNITRWYPNA